MYAILEGVHDAGVAGIGVLGSGALAFGAAVYTWREARRGRDAPVALVVIPLVFVALFVAAGSLVSLESLRAPPPEQADQAAVRLAHALGEALSLPMIAWAVVTPAVLVSCLTGRRATPRPLRTLRLPAA